MKRVSLALVSFYSPAALPRVARHLARTVRRADVVHDHLFPTSASLVPLQRTGLLPDVRLVFTEHNNANRRRGTLLERRVDSAIYAGMDQVIAISERTAFAPAAWMPNVSPRIRFIHNRSPWRASRSSRGRRRRVPASSRPATCGIPKTVGRR